MLTKYNDSLFSNNSWVFSDPFAGLFRSSTLKSYDTSYRCETDESGMELSVDLPGVKPEDIDVTTEGRSLIVSYKLRGVEQSQKFKVAEEYNIEDTKASSEHGVLYLKVPKRIRKEGKKIIVEVK